LKDENGNVKKKIVIAAKTKQSPSFYEIATFAITKVKYERTKLSTQFELNLLCYLNKFT
jgi:hypothetical protein